MPELAEVAFHAKAWARVNACPVEDVFVNESARCCQPILVEHLRSSLVGQTLTEAQTHGKRMLYRFSGSCCLSVHLGMTGSLRAMPHSAERAKHDHFVLYTSEYALVFNDARQFGKIEFFSETNCPDWWRLLPPEILTESFDRELFDGYCESRKRRPLKTFLLLQECFPGIGNWMADEILWQARLAPQRLVGSLNSTERNQLFLSTKNVCQGAMNTIAVDYSDPPTDWLFKHRWKAGGICPKTGKPLARDTIGGRTTCWSPAWQRSFA